MKSSKYDSSIDGQSLNVSGVHFLHVLSCGSGGGGGDREGAGMRMGMRVGVVREGFRAMKEIVFGQKKV